MEMQNKMQNSWISIKNNLTCDFKLTVHTDIILF